MESHRLGQEPKKPNDTDDRKQKEAEVASTPDSHLRNTNKLKSFGRRMLEEKTKSFPSEDDPVIEYTKEDIDKIKENLKAAAGIMSENISEMIRQDVDIMLKNEKYLELNGYVLAISRCIDNKKAWKAISSAFQANCINIPKSYYDLFTVGLEKLNQ